MMQLPKKSILGEELINVKGQECILRFMTQKNVLVNLDVRKRLAITVSFISKSFLL